MLCECISVWSEEFNGAECADLWHCGASTWQTEEKPEPARNEVMWAGVIICPAAWADSLFRDLKWSSCNGVCGPDYRWGSCSAMWYCTLSTIWKCAIPHFLKSSLRSALMLSSPLLLIAFVVFWILNYFLTEESYFHCSKPFTDLWMLYSFNKSRLCLFFFCEERRETWPYQQNWKGICSHLSWDRVHFLSSQYSAVFCV